MNKNTVNRMAENWIHVELGEVCNTTSGGTPSRRNLSYYRGNISWVKSGELNSNTILKTEEHISEEAVKNSSAKIFPKGSLLIALYGATIGKLAFLGIEAATNQAVCGIFKNENLESKFLYHFLFHKRQKLVEQGIGGAQPNISQTILRNLKIPIAPLPEQRAIVAKIERLFSELDAGINYLKAAREQLKIYRQAVLKKAFEGELTKQWREQQTNLPTAEDLLQEIKKERGADTKINGNKTKPIKSLTESELTKLPKLPETWCWVRFDEVTQKAERVNVRYMNSNEEFKYLDIGGINNQTNKIESYKIYTWASAPSRAQQIVLKGDTLFSTVRTYLRNIAKVDKDEYDKEICSSGFTVIRGIETYINSSFIFYLSIYEGFLQPLNSLQTGTSYPAVRDSDVFLQPFPLCSLQEQNQIVQEIETRLSVCDNIEANIKEALFKAKALRQSILKKAFEGKLLDDQELEETRRAPDWQPATQLLERIKTEQPSTKKEKVL
jgi:type I restriction enzyme S subunit